MVYLPRLRFLMLFEVGHAGALGLIGNCACTIGAAGGAGRLSAPPSRRHPRAAFVALAIALPITPSGFAIAMRWRSFPAYHGADSFAFERCRCRASRHCTVAFGHIQRLFGLLSGICVSWFAYSLPVSEHLRNQGYQIFHGTFTKEKYQHNDIYNDHRRVLLVGPMRC